MADAALLAIQKRSAAVAVAHLLEANVRARAFRAADVDEVLALAKAILFPPAPVLAQPVVPPPLPVPPVHRGASGAGVADSADYASGELGSWRPASGAVCSFAQQAHLDPLSFTEGETLDKCMGVDLVLPEVATEASLFGVVEGNGGKDVADFVRTRLHEFLLATFEIMRFNGANRHNAAVAPKVQRYAAEAIAEGFRANPGDTDTSGQLVNAFLACDADLCRALPRATVLGQGATAAFVFVRRNLDGSRHLYVANVGDVEVVLARGAGAAPELLSTKHSLQTAAGQADARSRGAVIVQSRGAYTMNGAGAFVRSFGNASCKPFGGGLGGTATPAVRSIDVTGNCDFVIIATEGFWAHVSHARAVAAVYEKRAAGVTDQNMADHLKTLYMEAAVARGEFGHDVSIMVLFLKH